MIKKIIFWSLVVGGVVIAVNSVRPGAISTAFRRVHVKFEKQIPPEFELARLKDQIAQLTPDMHRNISRIAEEMVQVESLDRRVVSLQTKLTTAKDELALLTNAFDAGKTRVVLTSGREVPITQINSKLNTCRNIERELANVKKIYDAKKAGVEAARQQLTEMKRQQQELEVLAAQYAAELKTLELEQTRAKLQLDDSRLAEIKQSFERLRERIEVERKTADLAEQFKTTDSITEKKPVSSTNVVEEAREYLGTATTEATKK